MPSKSDCWKRQQLVERLLPVLGRRGQDHLLHDREPLLGHEHVLGAAQSDALGAELARLGGVLGRVAVGANAEAAEAVSPLQDDAEVVVDRGRNQRHRADDDAAVAAVDGDDVALAEGLAVHGRLLGVEVEHERLAAGDAGNAETAGDDRGVRGHAAASRQDALGCEHAVDVVRSRLGADQDDALAGLAELGGGVGVEDGLAAGGARRGVQALGGDFDLRLGIDHGVQKLVELVGVDPLDGLFLGDQALGDHVHGRLERGAGGALARRGSGAGRACPRRS